MHMMKFEYLSIDKVFNANDDLFKEILKDNSKLSCPIIKKMSLLCNKDFTALINNKRIKIKKELGFEMNHNDPKIQSFKIIDDAVSVYALIAYTAKEV